MTRVQFFLLILFFLPGGLCAMESPEWWQRAGIIKPAARKKLKEPKIFFGCFYLKRYLSRSIERYRSRPRRPKIPLNYLYPERGKPRWRRLQREYREDIDKEEKKIEKEMKELDKKHRKKMVKLEDKGEWGKKLRQKLEERWEKLNEEIKEQEKKRRKENKERRKKFNK